jgi:hypothetical protein
MRRIALLAALVALFPSMVFADNDPNCTTLAQAAAAGLAATIQADNQSITQPQSVTTLSCLNNFFNGVGLNVITNFLNPTSLLTSVEGEICQAAQSSWQNTIGSQQCGLTVTGFNMGGFNGLGGGNFCPVLSFGGGGTPIGSVGTGTNDQGSMNVDSQALPPTGYTLPQTFNSLY